MVTFTPSQKGQNTISVISHGISLVESETVVTKVPFDSVHTQPDPTRSVYREPVPSLSLATIDPSSDDTLSHM